MEIYDVIIVGSGPAGMTAAIYAKRANLDVLLLDKLAPGGQIINTYEIQNYPGFSSVNGADLAMQVFEHTQALGIEFDYGTVEKIETEEREDGGCGTIKIVTCAEGKHTVPWQSFWLREQSRVCSTCRMSWILQENP